MAAKLVALARAEDVPEGEAQVFSASGEWVTLCRVAGRFYALEDRCSHDDGPLGEGPLAGFEIECPRHGACFDVRDGRATRRPASRPIRTFPVHLDRGLVLVELAQEG